MEFEHEFSTRSVALKNFYLPDEILCHIASFLDVISILNFSQSCLQCRKILTGQPTVWKKKAQEYGISNVQNLKEPLETNEILKVIRQIALTHLWQCGYQKTEILFESENTNLSAIRTLPYQSSNLSICRKNALEIFDGTGGIHLNFKEHPFLEAYLSFDWKLVAYKDNMLYFASSVDQLFSYDLSVEKAPTELGVVHNGLVVTTNLQVVWISKTINNKYILNSLNILTGYPYNVNIHLDDDEAVTVLRLGQDNSVYLGTSWGKIYAYSLFKLGSTSPLTDTYTISGLRIPISSLWLSPNYLAVQFLETPGIAFIQKDGPLPKPCYLYAHKDSDENPLLCTSLTYLECDEETIPSCLSTVEDRFLLGHEDGSLIQIDIDKSLHVQHITPSELQLQAGAVTCIECRSGFVFTLHQDSQVGIYSILDNMNLVTIFTDKVAQSKVKATPQLSSTLLASPYGLIISHTSSNGYALVKHSTWK